MRSNLLPGYVSDAGFGGDVQVLQPLDPGTGSARDKVRILVHSKIRRNATTHSREKDPGRHQ